VPVSDSAKDFVTVWQTSSTLDEVCDQTGLSRKTASARAANYRRNGVPLQRFSRPKMLNYEELAVLAEAAT